MSINNTFESKTLNGISYTLRKSTELKLGSAIGAVIAFTVMTPILVVSGIYQTLFPSSRDSIQAYMIPKMMAGVEKEFKNDRDALLSGVSGSVLDFGSGAGPYLKYCKKADEVVAVEPLADLHPSIRTNGAAITNLSIVKSVEEIPSNKKFDWVILGNVSDVLEVCVLSCMHNPFSLVSCQNKN